MVKIGSTNNYQLINILYLQKITLKKKELVNINKLKLYEPSLVGKRFRNKLIKKYINERMQKMNELEI